MGAAIAKAKELSEEKGYFLAMQFENPANPAIHEQTTGAEIIDAFGITADHIGLDAFVAGAGTGGTITGVSHALKKKLTRTSKLLSLKPLNLQFYQVMQQDHIKFKGFLQDSFHQSWIQNPTMK